jgi:hypothetical protein
MYDRLVAGSGNAILKQPKISGVVNGLPEDIERRYEAILRLSEVLSQCQEPEGRTEILSEELDEFLAFFAVLHHCLEREFDRSRMGRCGARKKIRLPSMPMCQFYSVH